MSSRADEKAKRREEREQAQAASAQQAARKRRLQQLGGVLAAAVVVVIVLIVISSSGTDDKVERKAGETVAGQTDVAKRFAGIPQDGIALGKPDAPVTLVEFADMQCPFCADFATDGLPGLVEQEVRAGTLRIEFRSLAFIGEDSERMARVVAAAAAQDKAWETLDLLFINQGQENSGFATDDFLKDVLGAVEGLDVDRVLAERSAESARKPILDAEELAKEFNVESTPSFLIGPTGGAMKPLETSSLDGGEIRSAVQKIAGTG